MAGYRAPRHPQVEHLARRQTLAARLVGLLILWILLVALVLVAERAIPDEHLPWKPLSVIDPVGAATKAKAARTGQDVAAIVLEDGQRLSVVGDFTDENDAGTLMRAARTGACDYFRAVLSPDYNAAHADHLHLDGARQSLCA